MVAIRESSAVITGTGLVSALGFGVEHCWGRILAGESGVKRLRAEDFAPPISLPILQGAAVDRDQLAQRIEGAVRRQVWNTSAPACQLWLLAALEAMRQAGLLTPDNTLAAPYAPARVGIFVGNGTGSPGFTEQEYVNVYSADKPAQRDVSRMAVPKSMSSSLAAQLAILTGIQGPSLTLNSACTASHTAIMQALDALRLGRIDCAITGGAELPLSAAALKGFANLGVLAPGEDSPRWACKPFHPQRKGMVLGEGAACLVLESPGAARKRRQSTLATLLGGALNSDGYKLLAPREEASGLVACLRLALADAGAAPESVAHVMTHGTGTSTNDRWEAEALRQVFPHRPTASASKAQLGHTLGAAGALDAVLTVKTLITGKALPMPWLDRPATDCPISPAPLGAHPAFTLDDSAKVVVTGLAFGGHNAALVLGKGEMMEET